MLDFPTSPTVGQSYPGPSGAAWLWDGAKWISATSGVVATYGNVGRNLIHNGMFNVAQRGAGPFTIAPAGVVVHTADRWAGIIGATGDVLSVAITMHNDANRAAIGDEAAIQFISCGLAGGSGADCLVEMFHRIENVRRLAGKSVTVSFWANSNSGLSIGVKLQQFFGLGGSPSTQVAVSTQTIVTTTTWTRYALTFAMPSASGKTFGTVAGTDYTVLQFWFSSGATNAPFVGVGVQSGTINLWGVQLEVGTAASPLEKRTPQEELAECQRYYQTGSLLWGGAITSGTYYTSSALHVAMRASPTVVGVNDVSSGFSARTFTALNQGCVYMSAAVATPGAGTLNSAFTASADL